MDTLNPMTHPETAWLLYAVTPALTVFGLLVAGLLARPRLAALIASSRAGRAGRAIAALPATDRPDPSLLWMPEPATPAGLAAACLAFALGIAAAVSLIAPVALALALAVPLTALVVWAAEAVAVTRYTSRLEHELTAAVGRLGALLRAGIGLRPALERVIADMPRGPLQAEWSFLLSRQGVPVVGGIATPAQVVAALADQTPSRRHAALLNHLGAAVGQPHEVLAARCEAAYAALQRSDRRRDEAVTELAQMRYSGLAVGLAGFAMAAYLAWGQWERVVQAYSTPLGVVVGAFVLAALCLPLAGGVLLARVDDVDY